MKKISIITLLMLICTLPGYSQFWVEFHWNEPHCNSCTWMAQALRLNSKQTKEYHKIVHKYGKKIEKEARRDYKHWHKAARSIYDLRVERDYRIQRMLTPPQFALFVRFTRERPERIHDYRGWYENPRYAGKRIEPEWRQYEHNYWNYHQENVRRPNNKPVPPKYNQQKPNNKNNNQNSNGRNDNRRNERDNNRNNNRQR